jgi:formate dehydrogenase subunit gamma
MIRRTMAIHALLVAGVLALFLGALPATAQQAPAPSSGAAEQALRQQTQPGNNAPVWRDVRSEKEHFTTTRGREAGVLIQSGGETWRTWRNNRVIPVVGWLLAGVVLAIGVFWLVRGKIRLHSAPTGRRMLRFTWVERAAHWTTAISFCILAVTGLVTMLGKYVLLPILGPQIFAFVTQVGKVIHNVTGPVFSVAVVIVFLLFVKDNLPSRDDLQWIKAGGGLFTDRHVPSHRFNAGEKSWFWIGVFALSTVVSVTGFILDFPNFDQSRATMQTANLIHGIAAGLVTAFALGHIYIGSVGMEGALDAMKTGYVDEAWAKEHHEYWYDAERAKAAAAPAAGGGGAATPPGQALAHAPHAPRSIG